MSSSRFFVPRISAWLAPRSAFDGGNENQVIPVSIVQVSSASRPSSPDCLAWDATKLYGECHEPEDILDLCNKFATVHISKQENACQNGFRSPSLHCFLDGFEDADYPEPSPISAQTSETISLPPTSDGSSGSVDDVDSDADSILTDEEAVQKLTRPEQDELLGQQTSTVHDDTGSLHSVPHSCVSGIEECLYNMATKLQAATLDTSLSQSIIFNRTSSSTLAIGARSIQLNRRLRPNHPNDTHDNSWCLMNRMESNDRYIVCRNPPGPSRDALLTKSLCFSVRNKKTLRAPSVRDPFSTTLRSRPAVPALVTTLQYQRPNRTIHSNSAQVLRSRMESMSNSTRQISLGAVWNVGGPSAVAQAGTAMLNRRGSRVGSGTNAPLFVSSFLEASQPKDELEMYEGRLALALDLTPSSPILRNTSNAMRGVQSHPVGLDRTLLYPTFQWKDLLAYSHSANCLAVGLADRVYLWTEKTGVKGVPRDLEQGQSRSAYITSVAFSSTQGGSGILAMARADGRVAMYSPLDKEPRYLRIKLPTAAAHVSFRPCPIRRPSQRCPSSTSDNEVLMVGDDTGTVSVYFVEWPKELDRYTFGWDCGVRLHVRLTVHTQQVCGISWSLDGNHFATGGNDNLCCLFNTKQMLNVGHTSARTRTGTQSESTTSINSDELVTEKAECVKYLWRLNAAVKAIAFCPWQRGLIAAGGGSNDRCIHFYHTVSGACLAKIDCAAQVTSLIWSTTRREIVSTFGFAQPEHPFRIAVYAWPSCQQVLAIPWHDDMRALYAIGYPGGPSSGHGDRNSERGRSRTAEEGCIVVAGSDGSIKFHEIWSKTRSATFPHGGLLGGSDILETLHGFDKEGFEKIR